MSSRACEDDLSGGLRQLGEVGAALSLTRQPNHPLNSRICCSAEKPNFINSLSNFQSRIFKTNRLVRNCCLLFLGKHYVTYRHFCTPLFYLLTHVAKNHLLLLNGMLGFCRLIIIYSKKNLNKIKDRIFIQISFAWLTDIFSTTWSEGKRKVRITAKIHIMWFFFQRGGFVYNKNSRHNQAEYMYQLT